MGLDAGTAARLRQDLDLIVNSSGLTDFNPDLRDAVAGAREKFASPGAKLMLEFVAATKRGVCADPGAAGDNDSEAT